MLLLQGFWRRRRRAGREMPGEGIRIGKGLVGGESQADSLHWATAACSLILSNVASLTSSLVSLSSTSIASLLYSSHRRLRSFSGGPRKCFPHRVALLCSVSYPDSHALESQPQIWLSNALDQAVKAAVVLFWDEQSFSLTGILDDPRQQPYEYSSNTRARTVLCSIPWASVASAEDAGSLYEFFVCLIMPRRRPLSAVPEPGKQPCH